MRKLLYLLLFLFPAAFCAQNPCGNETFLNIIGNLGDQEEGLGLYPAQGGNWYLTGTRNDSAVIFLVNPCGQILSSFSMGKVRGEVPRIADLITDSEGYLAVCGVHGSDINGSNFSTNAFVMRIRPGLDSVEWVRDVAAAKKFPTAIFQKNPGGDYIIGGVNRLNSDPYPVKGFLFEVSKENGLNANMMKNLVFGNFKFNGMEALVYDGTSIFATGNFTRPNSPLLETSQLVSQIDTATFEPQWTQAGHMPSGLPHLLFGRDIIISGNALIHTYSGVDDGDQLNTTRIYLKKTTKAGVFEWVKRYNLPEFTTEFAEEVVEVADGYVLYGRELTGTPRKLFVLKVDKNGTPLWAKKIAINGHADFSPLVLPQGQMVFRDTFLYLTGTTINNGNSDMFLIRMSENGFLGTPCDAVSSTPVFEISISFPVNYSPSLVKQTESLGGGVTGKRPNFSFSSQSILIEKTCESQPDTCTQIPNLGPDQTLCTDDPVSLNPGAGFANYTWQDGSTAASFTATGPGLYWVEVTDTCGNVFRDSINLFPNLLSDTQIPDQVLCKGDSISISLPGFDTYQWVPANAVSCANCPSVVIKPDSSVLIIFQGNTQQGCLLLDSFTVTVAPLSEFTDTLSFFEGDSVTIGGNIYSASTTVNLTLPGSGNACDTLATYVLIALPDTCTAVLSLGSDQTLCTDDPVTLDAGAGFASYSWQDGSSEQTFTATGPGLYAVEVTDACGDIQRDTILLAPNLLTDTQIPNQSICLGDSLSFSLPGFDNNLWQPANVVSCTNCANVVIKPTQSVLITFQGNTNQGCLLLDSFLIDVQPLNLLSDTITFLQGDTVWLGGNVYTQTGMVTLTLPGNGTDCDTLAEYTLIATPNPNNAPVCDSKTIGCIKFEVLDIRYTPSGDRIYRVRATNNCADGVEYFVFQVPNGTLSEGPANGSLYTAPSGRKYRVRTPNNSPFYSIRFKTESGILNNSNSDEFYYILSEQTQAAFLQFAAKMENNQIYSTIMTVQSCPILPAFPKPVNKSIREFGEEIRLFPNPTSGQIQIIPADKAVELSIFDAVGRLVQKTNATGHFQMDPALPGGVYSIRIEGMDGFFTTIRMILER